MSPWSPQKEYNWRAPFCCRKYSLDDLLTNVMIYWTSGCIVSSMRFYKENFGKGLNQPHTKCVTVQKVGDAPSATRFKVLHSQN